MTQEQKDQDAEVASQPVESGATQAETSEPLEALQAQISQLTSALEEAKREAKSHQEYGRKTREELDRQRGLDAKVSGLESKVEVVAEMMAQLLDKDDNEGLEPQPKQRKSAEYLAKLKQPVGNGQQTESLNLLRRYQERVEALGLTQKDSQYRQVYRLARTLDPMDLADAEEILQKLEAEKVTDTQKKTEAPVDIEKIIKEAILAGRQEERKSLGLLSSDTGTPGASGGKGYKVTLEELRAVSATEAKARVDSGAWVLPYGIKL